MLVAKLKSPLELAVQVSPVKIDKRIVDAFVVIPIAYQLNAEDAEFQVKMLKGEIVPKEPASSVPGEGETEEQFKLEKIFVVNLTSEELENWGSDDKALLGIFAQKYEIEIDSFIENGKMK